MTIRCLLVALLLAPVQVAQEPEPFAFDLLAVSTSVPEGGAIPAVRCELVRRYRVVEDSQNLAVVGERGAAPWVRDVMISRTEPGPVGRILGRGRRLPEFAVQVTMRVRRGSQSSGMPVTSRGTVLIGSGEWMERRSGSPSRFIALLPAPAGAKDAPEVPAAEEIADALARLVIEEEEPDRISNEVVAALGRLPLASLLDPRVRDSLIGRLREIDPSRNRREIPSPPFGNAAFHGRFHEGDAAFRARMVALDPACFDDWEGLAARAETDFGIRRNLPLAWAQANDPEIRGKIAAAATSGRNIRSGSMAAFLPVIVAAFEDGSAELPGTAEEKAALVAHIRRLAGELNYRPALVVIGIGAASLAALAFLSRRLLRF